MAYLGTKVQEAKAIKIIETLKEQLAPDEQVLAIFHANRVLPSISGLVITNSRFITVYDRTGSAIKLINEVAADSISNIDLGGGIGFKKLQVITKTGETIFMCGVLKEDITRIQSFLPKMAGRPTPITKRLLPSKQSTQVKKAQKAQQKSEKKARKQAEKETKQYIKWAQSPIGKEALKNDAIQEMRDSLREDRTLLVRGIVAIIRKHWNTLEDKFDQYITEDEYGNKLLDLGFKRELLYFSEHVVLPALKIFIKNEQTVNQDISLILQDAINLLSNIPSDYFDIKFDDPSTVIANKLLSNLTPSGFIDDELMYKFRTEPEILELYVAQSSSLFFRDSSITLVFDETLKTRQPMVVPPFAAIVFVIFSALHNSSKPAAALQKRSPLADFIGNDPYKYEEYIRKMLYEHGFSAKRTRGSGDYGVDVTASKNNKTFAIQCKLYNRPVGTKAIQEIISGRLYYGTDFAIVVSDNSFTPAAKELARKTNVVVSHHKDLLMIMEKLISSAEQGKLSERQVNSTQWKTMPATHLADQSDDNEIDELITIILPEVDNK